MSGAMGEFQDPLFSGNFLAALLPFIGQVLERNRLRGDPNLLAGINNQIGQYNQDTGYDSSLGRFGPGNPLGDPGSGYGGAFGVDMLGNPYSPVQGYARYGLGQMENAQGLLNSYASNLGQVASSAGIAAPAPMDLGIDALGLNPGAVEGTVQGRRHRPTPLRPIQAPDPNDWLGNFLGSFAVGTTSVPKTGLAQVHQGEAIVPKELNPQAQPPGVSGAPMLPQMQGGLAPGAVPQAPSLPAPPQYFGLQPGLSPQVQQQLINQNTEAIDREYAGMARQIRNAGPQGGGGVLDRRLFDAEMGRLGARQDLRRSVGIEAAARDFADRMAANEQLLGRYLGEGQLGLANRQQGLSEELGRGQLALGQGRLGLDTELGRGQLGLGQQEIDLQRLLGEGQLQLGQGRLGLDTELGRGQLGLGQSRLGLDTELGRGQLNLGQQELALQRLLGEGQLSLGQGRLGLDTELGRGELGLQRELGLGRLGLDTELGRGQLGLGREELGLQRELGLGRLGLDTELGRGQLDLERLLGEGQLALGNRGLDFQDRSFDAEFGRDLANDQVGLALSLLQRNDQLYRDQVQGQYMGGQQEQLGQLLQLLAQYAGQAA